MTIIAVLNPKGGCGKTTLATHLARTLHDQGRHVLLVDSDPQGSARDWHAATDNALPLVALDRANNLRTLPAVAAAYEFVILDGAAKLEDMLVAAVRIADAVLIPVQPSPYDIWAVADLVELVKMRQEVANERPQASFVVTRTIPRTKLAKEVYEALLGHGLAVLPTPMVQRQVYPQTAAEGRTVFDTQNREAITEARAVAAELLEFLEVPDDA